MRTIFFLLFLVGCSDVVTSERGPQGERGEQGERGPAGPPGPAASVALPVEAEPYVVELQELVHLDEYGSAVAMCDEGDSAVMGGCQWGKGPGGMLSHESRPALLEGEPVGWGCSGVSLRADETVTAWVVCE